MYPTSTIIELWNQGTISRAELISFLGTRPDEPLDVLQDSALQTEVEKFRQAVADGIPLVLIGSHC